MGKSVISSKTRSSLGGKSRSKIKQVSGPTLRETAVSMKQLRNANAANRRAYKYDVSSERGKTQRSAARTGAAGSVGVSSVNEAGDSMEQDYQYRRELVKNSNATTEVKQADGGIGSDPGDALIYNG